jgi:hypothetical protein
MPANDDRPPSQPNRLVDWVPARDTFSGYLQLVPMVAIAAYALTAVVFVFKNFLNLAQAEKNGFQAAASAMLPQTVAAGAVLVELLIAIVIVLICILCIWFFLTWWDVWRQRIATIWSRVVNCPWTLSWASFWTCLKGGLFAAVETIIWVLVTLFCLAMMVVNIVGLVLLIIAIVK